MAKQAYVYSGTDWVPLASEVTNLSAYQTKALAQASNRNLVINGDMQVAQRNTSAASITSVGYFTADRWFTEVGTLGTWTQSVENDAPTGSGFRKSLKMLCTTADASPAAGDYLTVQTRFEGQNLQHIKKGTSAAEQLTVSFWVKSNVTGTYTIFLYDNDNTRMINASYTINTSATWEKKTITFAADTTGAFDNDNAYSLALYFNLSAGSNRTSGTISNTWAAYSVANEAPGQVNLASATNNYWQITGVQLEVGDTATPFEFKSYAQDLVECQRYYQVIAKGSASGNQIICNVMNYNSTAVYGVVEFPVSMRTAPTVTQVSGTNYFLWEGNNAGDSFNSITIELFASENKIGLGVTSGIAVTQGQSGWIRTDNAAAVLAVQAEL